MKSIRINKSLNYKKESIEVRYEGINKQNNVDSNKIEELLNDFMENHSHCNMVENVSILRTILNNYDEKLLVVYYQNENGLELVKYDNTNLVLFKKIKKNDNNKNQKDYQIKYEILYGINYNIYNSNFTDCEVITNEFSQIISHLFQLKNVHALELDRDSKSLIEIYKIFYDENPNFSDKNINIKIQSMMSILAEFGIILGDDYSFMNIPNLDMPLSLNLCYLVKKLYPFGEISFVDNPIELTDYSKKVIKIAGENIRKAIIDSDNKDEMLMMISQIIYASRYRLHLNANIEDICEFTHCTLNEVETSIKLVKCIQNRIDKYDN